MLSLGVYPQVSLKEARVRRDEAHRLIAQGLDPSSVRKSEKAEVSTEYETFERVAREWFAKFQPNWTPSHAARTMRRFEMDVFPWMGRGQSRTSPPRNS